MLTTPMAAVKMGYSSHSQWGLHAPKCVGVVEENQGMPLCDFSARTPSFQEFQCKTNR